MTRTRSFAALVLFLAAIGCGQPATPQAQATLAQAQPEPQEEFVPLNELPPQDQLAAAPLLIAAYSFVVVMLFLYVISVGRRMATVQKEIERLESDIKRSGRT
jgi:CcmD family protein